MRIRIAHETTYRYAPAARSMHPEPAADAAQLRLAIRAALAGRASTSTARCACRGFARQRRAFASRTRSRSSASPSSAVGEVETDDAVGVVRGAVETAAGRDVLARQRARAGQRQAARLRRPRRSPSATDPLERLHRLMERAPRGDRLRSRGAVCARRGRRGVRAEARRRGRLRACLHRLRAPSRNSGPLCQRLRRCRRRARRPPGCGAWAEALAPELGWVAFDCAHDLCPDARYVRVAVGFDCASAAPLRSSHSGVGVETVATALQIQAA